MGFEEKHIMEKNGFEVPGGGRVSGDGVQVRVRVRVAGCREISNFPQIPHFFSRRSCM